MCFTYIAIHRSLVQQVLTKAVPIWPTPLPRKENITISVTTKDPHSPSQSPPSNPTYHHLREITMLIPLTKGDGHLYTTSTHVLLTQQQLVLITWIGCNIDLPRKWPLTHSWPGMPSRPWTLTVYPSMNEWIKRCGLYTMECHSATRKKKTLTFVMTWMGLQGFMLSEISQAEQDQYCAISLICGI